MKTKKNYPLMILLGACVLPLIGCGGGSGGSKTSIRIKMHSGTGTKESPTWIQQCASRFEELNRETSFADGKKGVNITFVEEKISDNYYNTMAQDGFNIIIDETRFDAYKYKNNLMDITEVVDLYKDKIDSSALLRCKADQSEDKYYGLPFYEYFPGISYDIDLFEKECYYFADSSASDEDVLEYTCTFNSDVSIRLINSLDVKKAPGPDGQYNTSDDGLPSSIMEFLGLCDLLSSDGISPLVLCGSGTQYSWYLVDGMWSSLSGADAMNTVYCNYKDGGTTLNVVTGYDSSEELFFAGSGIKKPITQTVSVTDTNGYLSYSTVERYYALSLLQLLFSPTGDTVKNSIANKTSWINTWDGAQATNAQSNFVNGNQGKRYAMLYDSSYWYHEDIKEINEYNAAHPNAKRKVAHMPLPTQFEGHVEENQGKQNTLMDVGSTYIFVNKNTAQFQDKSKAVIEFLKYLYSDEQLNDFTSVTGLTVPKDSGFSYEGLDEYYQQLAKFKSESNIIHYASSNPRFLKNLSSFNIGYGSNLCSVDGNREGYYLNFINGLTAEDIFKATQMKETNWNNMAK